MSLHTPTLTALLCLQLALVALALSWISGWRSSIMTTPFSLPETTVSVEPCIFPSFLAMAAVKTVISAYGRIGF